MFPTRRMRRVRSRTIQPLLCETTISKNDLVAPLFVDETASAPVPISSMPGQFRYPVSGIAAVVQKFRDRGIRAVLLFGIPAHKDEGATAAYDPQGVVQQAVRNIKAACPDMLVITDVCACEYTSHGHCGIVGDSRCSGPDLLNDESLLLMNKIATSHAEAGADIVAPSCMLDGMVGSIRAALDTAGYEEVLILSYSTKFSSALYGPFREAAESGFSFGDRTTYQMNPANGREAFLESQLDADEGADILMVKPAGPYLDVLADVATLGLPVAAYQVSGEYSMIKAAAERGWIKEKETVLETLTCIKRAGADLIITYFAYDVCGWLS
ncbi:Porphobilinogen synthase [Methanoregula boonei 6A8]|uniref:Delta-aminolevulinic acid dehydratase n=1 Tax=Methanoregula boonei (strain DSM 21154 / JCM 14090 / 6A8) TaxID=456442 RepID=A7I7P3_METB6|nr:porphobilinogen synthase [Methanoregula boonei]ABS55754.1 Porphobilinogen synthase [Methanoregula boonei 6A8]